MYESYKLCKQGTIWKSSVQKMGLTLSAKLVDLVDKCFSRTYMSRGFHEFTINERGKLRHIRSVCIEERVVQKTFVRNCLKPILKRYIIYDNGATIELRGIHHQIDRLCVHLQRHFKEYGLSGFIFLYDFENFFGSIPTNALVEAERDKVIFENVMFYVEKFIYAFGKVGIGLGSEISQISAVFYPSPIDHYIKDQMHIKGYGRYADDGYIIHHSKKFLKKCIIGVEKIAARLGLKLKKEKCRIQKISRQFTFLKTRIRLTSTGRIIKRVVNKTITRERRRLKKYRKLYERGQMTFNNIEMAYKSWKGSISKRGLCYRSIQNLNRLFNALFIYPFLNGRDYYERPQPNTVYG